MTLVRSCIGCGYCCVKATCALGWLIYPDSEGLCPALEWTGERHVCRLARLPGVVGEACRSTLAIDAGCCSSLNSWRQELLKDRTGKGISRSGLPLLKSSYQAWLEKG